MNIYVVVGLGAHLYGQAFISSLLDSPLTLLFDLSLIICHLDSCEFFISLKQLIIIN